MKQKIVAVPDPKKTTPDVDKGSSEESIGRPSEWGEGRYEEAGTPIDESVVRKPGEAPPDTTSTTVTEKDYQGH
jgi:hypothetical protein